MSEHAPSALDCKAASEKIEALKTLKAEFEAAVRTYAASGTRADRDAARQARARFEAARAETYESFEGFRDAKFQKRSVETLKELFDEGFRASVAQGLAGLDSPEAWELRNKLLAGDGDTDMRYYVAQGLAGLDSQKAWELRIKLLTAGGREDSILLGLAGLDTPQAWTWREQLAPKAAKDSVATSLVGLDSPEAWKIREELLGTSPIHVARSLAGLDTPQAWAMREELLTHGKEGPVAEGLAGLDTPQAWKMRRKILADGYYGSVALGLAGLDTPWAWMVRRTILGMGAMPYKENNIVLGLVGVDSPEAWAMRRALIGKDRTDKSFVARSLYSNVIMAGVRKARADAKRKRDNPE